MNNLETQAKKVFGITALKPLQKEIISHSMESRHSLIIMPTGWGKSLCYQIFSLIKPDQLSIVVSPLIALMQNQVERLKEKHIPAEALHSLLSQKQKESRLKNLNKYRLLFVTPERFQKPEFMKLIKKQNICLLAVDEAHCISQWGHDFRPDYSRLGEVRKQLNYPVTQALTATADKQTQKDILKNLFLPKDTKIFTKSVLRNNLHFSVHQLTGIDNKILLLQKIIKKYKKGLIYFSLIQTLEKTAEILSTLKIPFTKYHSGLSSQTRSKNQNLFLNGEADLMLATPAFGLGIDKKDIRFIVHFEIPLNLPAYYQEAGRAGRDNNPAFCFLLYDEDDLSICMDFIKWSNPSTEFIKRVFWFFKKNPALIKQAGLDYIREQMNFYNKKDFRVETAVNLLKRWNFLIETRNEFTTMEEENNWPDPKLLKKKQKHQLINLQKIVAYAKSSCCRKQLIAEHFGEFFPAPCKICDNCS